MVVPLMERLRNGLSRTRSRRRLRGRRRSWRRRRSGVRNEGGYLLPGHQHRHSICIHAHFGRRGVMRLLRQLRLRLHVQTGRAPARRRTRRRRRRRRRTRPAPEEPLEDGHEEEHGDEDGRGHEPERHRVHRVVEVRPPAFPLGVRRLRRHRRRWLFRRAPSAVVFASTHSLSSLENPEN